MTATCRCGYTGEGQHPCHGAMYTCRKPATQRFYGCRYTSLAGLQMKLGASETWACDECWEAFKGARVRVTGGELRVIASEEAR